jgi:DNA-binding MarR family transcriptional regulator
MAAESKDSVESAESAESVVSMESERSMDFEQLCNNLEENFAEVYAKFKIHFYQEMFTMMEERETSLSAVETFCVELIHALGSPTVNEFSSFINISPPNAAYKVNSLIKKGYIKKERSKDDKREYHLMVTDKYFQYYNLNTAYLKRIMARIREHFDTEQVAFIARVLQVMNEELMPEVPRCNVAAEG